MIKLRVALPTFSCIEQYTIAVLNFKGPVRSITYDSLISKLCDFTKTKKGKFYVSWHDGTEYCTISTSDSLREAIVTMIYDREDKTPLLFASPVFQLTETKLPSFYGGCRPENLPKDFRDRAAKAEFAKDTDYTQPEFPINLQMICSVCKTKDWQGDRYTCVICPKIVLCPNCFKNNKHSQHPVLITRRNTEFPCQVLQAVKIVAADVNVEDSEDSAVEEEEEVGEGGEEEEEEEDNDTEERWNTSTSRTSSSSVVTDVSGEVYKVLFTLREMGFQQRSSELTELIIKERGNLQTIVEKLTD
uniref:ZZ-type domain-containing protein n=2 Tax=Trichobilharzia regenti TaxID=157069 RepID=A0AA85KBJ6_TRIRE|nr:unnamed protein product [Trichobilharzia regenti]